MFFDPSLFLAQQPSKVMETVDWLARTPLSQILLLVAVCTVIRMVVFPKLMGTPQHQRYGRFRVVKFLNEFCDAIVYAGVIVFLLIRPFAVQTFNIPSQSMESTLMTGDFIVANKFTYRGSDPVAGDIVVFRPPARAMRQDPTKVQDYIKRCVGTPGQVIEIRSGNLYRNGKLVDEPYVKLGNSRVDFKLVNDKGRIIPCVIFPDGGINTQMSVNEYLEDPNDLARQEYLTKLPPAPIPAGFYLMMGDNRNASDDGRFWGLVPRRSVIAKPIFVFMPFSRIGTMPR